MDDDQTPARRSSGVYDPNFASSRNSLNSETPIREHAVPPAGWAMTTTAGVNARRASDYALSDQALVEADEPQIVQDTTTPSSPHASQLATAPTPFYKKRWFIISQLIIIPLGIALLFILLFPIVKAIVVAVVKKTTLDIQAAIITNPTNTSFDLHMQGFVYHTGIIPAKIMFKEDTKVFWVENSTTQTELGSLWLHDLHSAKNKRAVINDTTTFSITNEEAFGRFSGSLITSRNFTWRLLSQGLHVQALKFPTSTGITFDKMVTINGFNSFDGNVVLRDLQLPRDNPAGGIDFVAVTELHNTSPFSIDLGTVVFDLSYKGVPLGVGTGVETKILPGNNSVTLKGTLQPHTNPSDLAAVSELFTRYLNGESSPVVATGQSTQQSDGTGISWLSEGLKDLNLNVPFKAFRPIDPIRSITIGNLSLQFDKDRAWTPAAESHSVQASLQLPFGFSVAIGEIQNNFSIFKNGSNVVGLSTPLGASTSSVSVLSTTSTVGTIDITITDTRLECPEAQHAAFSAFNRDLTMSKASEFKLVGQSRAIANMSIGEITLDPIKVNVSTSLNGLQGLQGMTTIQGVDVTGGTSSGITLAIDVSIYNPSNLQLVTGDLSLQLSRDGAVLGTALMPNLTLNMGNNSVKATSSFEANNSPQGRQTLDDFVGKKDVQLTISGYDGSTQVASLSEAFQSLSLDMMLPALQTDLLSSATLKILSTTGRENNISHVSVSLANPFSSELQITRISSSVSAFGIPLGSIEQEVNFSALPNSTTSSPDLDLNMNFDPAALFTVTQQLALESGLDTAPLDRIVELGGYQYLSTSNGRREDRVTMGWDKRQASLFRGFDLPTFVLTAFKQLKSDVQLTTGLTIGEYQTQIHLTQAGLVTATDESLDLILPILAAPIVQRIVSGSTLGLDTVLIQDPTQTSFGTRIKGNIANAGPFDAIISFPDGLTINWQGRAIGKVAMSDVRVVGDVGGTIDAQSQFEVADVSHLAEFTKTLLTQESFEWEISGQNLTGESQLQALGISVPGIELPSRRVVLKGFNGLKDSVKIQSFDLPSNDPSGGIHLTLKVTAANPSQVGIQLSSIGFNTEYNGIMIAPVVSTGEVTLAPLSTSGLSLAGRLVPQQTGEGLAAVSEIFNNFIHGKDTNIIVHGASAGSPDVTWLNDGIKVLEVATNLPNQGVLDVIKSISLNELTLMFSTQDAYSPLTSSKSTDAGFAMPFGFPLDITSLQQTIFLGYQDADFARLTIPRSTASTDVIARVIHLNFRDIPLEASNHAVFENFLAATTLTSSQTVRLSGMADADANTAVGMLSLRDIAFSVETTIDGLQGLDARPVIVANLDVNHGYPDYLLIKVDSALYNPSNITIGIGDVSFGLQFEGQVIGEVDVANLIIVPGNQSYPTDVHFGPQGAAASAGRDLLQNFIQGIDSQTAIIGSDASTRIESLQEALSGIRLSPVVIPSLHQNVISRTTLVFPMDIVQTGLASATFVLDNPFTASIKLLRVEATATYQGLTLGTILSVDVSIRAEGHSSVASQSLPLNFNLEPAAIIQLLLLNSKANGVDLGPLVSLFEFITDNPDYRPPVKTSVDTEQPTCVSGQQFDVFGAILKSLADLKVDLAVNSVISLDDYPTELTFTQKGVPAITDATSLYLIGAVAGPIAQRLVDGAVLSFKEADIKNIAEDGFDLSLKGSLTNTGPLDALITFTEPVLVTWNGQAIAEISLPPVCASADAGVPNYEPSARLTVKNPGGFTEFATYMLHNPSFEWTISTPKLRLTALGTIFDDVSLSKTITFKAFNGLPGVTISNFELPSDDPAGGIHIETDASIPSQAQIGIELGTATFMSYFKDIQVGPLSASNLSLAAGAVTKAHLAGRILPQSGDNLDTIGELFSGYLNGANQTLQTRGYSVVPPGAGSPVQWLSNAFKTLSLDVILPGEKLQVIQAIELNDLEVVMKTQDEAFAPPTSSKNTVAKYKNPFGFSLQVVESGQTIILGTQGMQMAKLIIPRMPANGGVSTGNIVDLIISFKDIPLQSLDNDAFALLFSVVTLLPDLDADLSGHADVLARTAIGDVPISDIPIAVTSHLQGINGFGGVADLSNISVTGSGGSGSSEYIVAPLTTKLQNPSNVSLDTVDISLPVTYKGVRIGRAAIKELDLIPGGNTVDTEFHYQPADANDTTAQSFLTDYLQTGNRLDLRIEGDASSSPFASLVPALSGLELSSYMTGLNEPNLIKHITVYIGADSLLTNYVSAEFTLLNPLDAPLVVEFVQSDQSVEGEIYAQFSQAFDSFIVPPGQTVSSGKIPNVLLSKGALDSLIIIPLGYLDVAAGATVRVGEGGYQIPFLKLSQEHVPTEYTIDLDLFDVAAKMKSSSSAGMSSTRKSSSTVGSTSGVGHTLATVLTTSTDVKRLSTSGLTSNAAFATPVTAPKISSALPVPVVSASPA